MIPQDRLFRLATESLTLTANFVPREGWRLSFSARRGDEHWSDVEASLYDRLSTSELADVVAAEIAEALGL